MERLKVVIKLGSNVVLDEQGQFAFQRLEKLLSPISHIIKDHDLVIVSSGAIGLGRGATQNRKKTLKTAERQALASIGQNRLMLNYENIFSKSKQNVAQVLLTRDDLSNRIHYNNLRQTLQQLLEWRILPIVNENDSVSTLELKEDLGGFGDNDKLSALIAVKMNASLLVLLSDVDGVYDKNPKTERNSKLISKITNDNDLSRIALNGQSDSGRGGMKSKIEAARIAAWSGVPVVIANGHDENTLNSIFDSLTKQQEFTIGTYFTARSALQKKKHWIGFSSGVYGQIHVNEGAAKALIVSKKSLLPVGVIHVDGEFTRNQVVSVMDQQGRELGRGITYFSSHEISKIKGLKSQEALKMVENPEDDVIIQRDNFVSFLDEYTIDDEVKT